MDISKLKYEEWIDFVFNHPVEETPWHFAAESAYETIDPAKVVAHLTRLFTNPAEILSRYTREQIDQGFWFIPGPNGLMWSILDKRVPWEARRACIRATCDLLEQLFGQHDIGSSGYMWWDSLITYSAREGRDVVSDRAVLAEIINTLGQLTKLHSQAARDSAQIGRAHV